MAILALTDSRISGAATRLHVRQEGYPGRIMQEQQRKIILAMTALTVTLGTGSLVPSTRGGETEKLTPGY